jgi:sugar phosphate isomerase/epimerase
MKNEMKKPFVALQLYTVRDFIAEDLQGTLRKIKEMGYDFVELAGTYGLEAIAFRKMLDEIGLSAKSAHVGFDALEENLHGTLAEYKKLGCKFIVIPMLEKEKLPGGSECSKDALEKFCAACKSEGLVPVYHNHDTEFETLPDGTFKLDKLFSDLPDMYAEIDTGWVTAAGQSPEAYIAKYAGRCPLVHFKDTAANADNVFEDRPVGKGSQNIPKIIEAALSGGVEGFVAELDKAVGMTALEAASQSREYLKSLGY